MKSKLFLMACLAGLIAACSPKKSVVSVPPSQIDLEQLKDSIDYAMDVTGLSLADVRTLRNAPAAQRGYPFKDSYIRDVFLTTTWYDSLMWAFDENLPYAEFPIKEGEDTYDYYDRMFNASDSLKYNDVEKAFIARLQEREKELLKQNFAVDEGLRVNMTNLANPTQLKEFDPQLSQQLAQDGFAIVPARNYQLFQVYEQNDYSDFPSFVTTDLYLQLYHLYIDCMLRELETYHLYALMYDYSYEMMQEMKAIYKNSNQKVIEDAAARNIRFFNVAYHLFTGMTPDPGNDELVAEEVASVRNHADGPSNFITDYKEIPFAYSLFRPRGHYTRNHVLQEYFEGMMWLQSVPFGMDHAEEVNAAVMIAYVMKDNPKIKQKYDKLDKFITFLMGNHDDLSILQVINEVNKAGLPMEELLTNKQAMDKLKKNLEQVGNKQTRIRPAFEKTSHNKICVLPQRY